MELIFEKVYSTQREKIKVVFNILKISGKDMYKKKGLVHWKNEYPIEFIKNNCDEREVFLVSDKKTRKYVNTFQLELFEQVFVIEKFATLPEFEGLGIGRACLEFIERYSEKLEVKKIRLDVYDKSEHAINFYSKWGFKIIDKKKTRRFEVFIMEKDIEKKQ